MHPSLQGTDKLPAIFASSEAGMDRRHEAVASDEGESQWLIRRMPFRFFLFASIDIQLAKLPLSMMAPEKRPHDL